MSVTPEARARRAARAARNQPAVEPTEQPTNQPTEEPTVTATDQPSSAPTTAATDQPTDVRALPAETIRAGLADGTVTLDPVAGDEPGEVGRMTTPRRDDDPPHETPVDLDGVPPERPRAVDDALVAGQAIVEGQRKNRGGRPPKRHGHGLLNVDRFAAVLDEGTVRQRPGRGGVSPVNVAVRSELAERLDDYVNERRKASGSRVSKREVVEALLDELLGDPR